MIYITLCIIPLEATSNEREGGAVSKILVNHKAEDAHHGGPTIVELDGTLLELPCVGLLVPAKVEGAIAEVAGELPRSSSVGGILHDEELEEANEGDHLEEALLGDGIGTEEGGDTVGVGVKGMAGVVDIAGKVDASAGGDLAEEGQLGDPAVLQLNVTELVKSLLIGARKKKERVVEACGDLDTHLGREVGGKGRRRLPDLSRRKCRGGRDKKRSDGKLVHDSLEYCDCLV